MPAPAIHLHLIAYNEATRAAVAPPWAMLDNLANARPDWFEYWPIRQRLLSQSLDEAAFYGFFSPKFSAKTGLDHAALTRFIAERGNGADVLLFSPQPDMGAFFLNVFEQNETFDPGFIAACEGFLAHIGQPMALRGMVMDTRQICFSNYFVAKPAFWRAWLALNERLFAICEGHDATASQTLRAALVQPTTYAAGVQRKVFVMERLASLLLATQPRWRCAAHDPFGFAWSASRLREMPQEAFMSDALKRAYRESGWPEYLGAFAKLRDKLMAPRA